MADDQQNTLSYNIPIRRPGADVLTWVQNNTRMLGQDQFFGLAGNPQFDWPVPYGPRRSIDLLTHLHNGTRYASPYELFGHPQYDWPVPKGPRRAIDLLTHINQSYIPSFYRTLSPVRRAERVSAGLARRIDD